jgi:hypothetical protein
MREEGFYWVLYKGGYFIASWQDQEVTIIDTTNDRIIKLIESDVIWNTKIKARITSDGDSFISEGGDEYDNCYKPIQETTFDSMGSLKLCINTVNEINSKAESLNLMVDKLLKGV